MSKERTIQGIKEFFDNEEILKYPNLEYSPMTMLTDPNYFRIYRMWEGTSVIGIFQLSQYGELQLYIL